jgi:predicted nucleic acid-binding protein
VKVVVDASVVMKWFVIEDFRPEAKRLEAILPTLIAPDFLLIEIANIAWKKVMRTELDPDDAALIVPQLRRSGLRLLPTESFLGDALTLAQELAHPVYDCLYIAVMDLLGARFVTWDRPLFQKLAATRFAPRVYLLPDVTRLLGDLAGPRLS